MVARAWEPEPDSLYGRYWVDRPPPIIWLVQATDRIGGPYAHRLLGALACSLLVLAAAAAAREVAVRAGVLDAAAVRRLAGWVAVATAALVCNAEIDPVGAKGELFGIPLVMASCWLALRAVRRVSAGDAFLAGLLAMLAVGMKQSIVGGLVFGTVLLAGSLVARQREPARRAALRRRRRRRGCRAGGGRRRLGGRGRRTPARRCGTPSSPSAPTRARSSPRRSRRVRRAGSRCCC